MIEIQPTPHRFPGGLTLPGHKVALQTAPIDVLPLPEELVLPLRQHPGAPALPLVAVGQRVSAGERLAAAPDPLTADLHAPADATVVALERRPLIGAPGAQGQCLVLACTAPGVRAEPPATATTAGAIDMPAAEIRRRLAAAGVAGLGGAAFPAATKAGVASASEPRLMILNGAECEPYVACDEALLRTASAAVLRGAEWLRCAAGAAAGVIAIEGDKPAALAAMAEALTAAGWAHWQLQRLPVRYPAGAERQLIELVTGEQIGTARLPAEAGIVCHNVGTAYAAWQALEQDRAMTHRVVTVTGGGVARPANVLAPIGTPLSALIAFCGGYTARVQRLIVGGPLTGVAVADDARPITKGTHCVLAAAPMDLPNPGPERACIRCGDCVAVCPARLLPQQLLQAVRRDEDAELERQRLFDCIECGLCAHVCPSHIPLVSHYRHAKALVRGRQRDATAAAEAKARYEARERRLAAEAAALATAREARRPGRSIAPGEVGQAQDRRDAIQAALDRARARTQDTPAPASPPDEEPPAS